MASKEHDKVRYVLCINDAQEYERLRKHIQEKLPDAEAAQVLPARYITRDVELRLAYFVGNGNIKDERGRQIERRPVVTEPVLASDHWNPGTKGRFGEVRLPEFLSACAQAIRKTSDETGCPANTSVRHYDAELTVVYG